MTWAAIAGEYLIFWLLLPFLLLHPRVRQGIRLRLGLYDGVPLPAPGPRVWLHGASAGDVLGLVPIVRELKALRPDARVIISAVTDSGASMARQRLVPESLAELVTFLPYDLPGACRRAVAALRPDVLVLEYTELWPQLIRAPRGAGVKLALTNGRLAPAQRAAVPAALPAGRESAGEVRRPDDARRRRGGAGALCSARRATASTSPGTPSSMRWR